MPKGSLGSTKLGDAVLHLRTTDTGFARGLSVAGLRASSFITHLSLGTAAAIGFGGAMLAAGKAATNVVKTVETSFSKIEGLVGISSSQLESWRESMRHIAVDYARPFN